MPRRNRAKREEPPVLRGGAWQRLESAADGEWIVRQVAGSHGVKAYRCPGCDHEIPPGMPHVVTWPADEYGTVADRRHWHRSCWDARGRRRPTSRRRW